MTDHMRPLGVPAEPAPDLILCPACEGDGQVPDPRHIYSCGLLEMVCCGACAGHGWIDVDDMDAALATLDPEN